MNEEWTFAKDDHDVWTLRRGGRFVYCVHDILLAYDSRDLADVFLAIIDWLRDKPGGRAVEGLNPGIFMKGWNDEMGKQ